MSTLAPVPSPRPRASLAGARAKVNRAVEQFDSLEAEIGAWINRQPQEIRHDVNPETGRYRFTIRNAGRVPPARWSVIIGEIIHNLRSALDHIVWQLVIANGRVPSEANQFPIYSANERGKQKGRERKAKWIRMLRDVHPTHRAFIKALQPYRRRHRLLYVPLERLVDMSNEDKHRLLITTVIGLVPAPDSGPILVLDAPPPGARYLEIRRPAPTVWPWPVLLNQTELLSFRIDPPHAQPNMRVNQRLGATMGLGEGPSILPLRDILNLVDEVRRISTCFSRLIE